MRFFVPIWHRQGFDFDSLRVTNIYEGELGQVAFKRYINTDFAEACAVGLNLFFAKVELMAVHPLNCIKGCNVSSAGVFANAFADQSSGNSFKAHRLHL